MLKLFAFILIILSSVVNGKFTRTNLGDCNLAFSRSYGKNGGDHFSDAQTFLNFGSHCDMRVEEVRVRSYLYVDQVSLKLSDGHGRYFWTNTHGDNGGDMHSFHVPAGEKITSVLISSGRYVDSIQFVTDRGTYSQKFGGNGGTPYFAQLKGHLVGFYGRAARFVDQIGFISIH